MKPLILTLVLLLAGCSGSDDDHESPELTAAESLSVQFGDIRALISVSALDALLSAEDQSSPVTLVQYIEVTDFPKFEQYEQEVADTWTAVGADAIFASEVFGQLISDRAFTSIRAIAFPNIPMFLDAINSPDFTRAMNTMAAASGNQVWVLGKPMDLPEPSGSYTDSELQGLTREDAIALLEASESEEFDVDFVLDPEQSVFVDMIVSDDPAPFWMANLIKFHELAQYPDDPDSTLTGLEANELYVQTLIPRLIQYNSLPELVVHIDIVLTDEEVQWEEAVLQRYASRDAFLRLFPLYPDVNDAIRHKNAAVSDTLVLATEKLQ